MIFNDRNIFALRRRNEASGKATDTGLRIGTKEPVAYLYNGVRLPPLPERDEEAYPHALIYQASCYPYNYEVVFAASYYAKTVNYSFSKKAIANTSDGICYWHHSSSGQWIRGTDWYVGEQLLLSNGTEHGNTSVAIWTNKDILYENGKVLLAASEPVPVYE